MNNNKPTPALIISGEKNKEEVLAPKTFTKIYDGQYYVDGHHLTLIKLGAELKCKKDVDDLINLLQIAKHAFTK